MIPIMESPLVRSMKNNQSKSNNQTRGGKRRGAGRKLGKPNKNTTALKDMILGALSNAGGINYLCEQADANPAAFMTLVGKVLPLTVTGNDGGPVEMVIRWREESDGSPSA